MRNFEHRSRNRRGYDCDQAVRKMIGKDAFIDLAGRVMCFYCDTQ